jgi:hypothetical protein
MNIILKFIDLEKNNFKLIKLSENYGSGCRITDLIDKNICYDDTALKNLRRKFYKTIIEKLISRGFNIEQCKENEVTNTLHDRVYRFYRDNNFEIDLIEIQNNQFPFVNIP